MSPSSKDNEPPGSFDFSSLKKQLLGHNDYFDSLVNMIPSQVYNVPNSSANDEYHNINPKYHKGMSKESKETKRALQKAAKISKFENPETTVGSRIRKRQEEEEQRKNAADPAIPTPDDGSLSRIEQLRAKLRAKIAEKQLANRPTALVSGEDDTAGAISKRAARRAEKLKRIAAAKAKKATTTGGKSNVIQQSLSANKKVPDPVIVASEANKVEDDLAGIDFGSMAGFVNTPNYKNNKSLANLGKKKSLDRLLVEVEAKRKRLKELKESEDQIEREKASRIEWSEVLRDAASSKSKQQLNDPTLIKKALKRKAKQKASSAKSWEARTRQTEESVAERQKIRSHNLEKRKIGGTVAANLSKNKVVEEEPEKSSAKRRRMGPHANRAGFEGKKQDYINGGDSNKKQQQVGKSRGNS